MADEPWINIVIHYTLFRRVDAMSSHYSRILCLLAALPLGLAACGDDGGDGGGNPIDAASPQIDAPNVVPVDAPSADANLDCAVQLAPLDDGTDGTSADSLPVIVISEVKPNDFVEVYNTTTDPVSFSADLAGWQWCSRPIPSGRYRLVSGDNVTVPGLSYIRLDYPLGATSNDNGEMALYINSGYGLAINMVDFVCWGDPESIGTSRKGVALTAGKWSGDCTAAIPADGSIHRLAATTGVTLADYDVDLAPSGQTCLAKEPDSRR